MDTRRRHGSNRVQSVFFSVLQFLHASLVGWWQGLVLACGRAESRRLPASVSWVSWFFHQSFLSGKSATRQLPWSAGLYLYVMKTPPFGPFRHVWHWNKTHGEATSSLCFMLFFLVGPDMSGVEQTYLFLHDARLKTWFPVIFLVKPCELIHQLAPHHLQGTPFSSHQREQCGWVLWEGSQEV